MFYHFKKCCEPGCVKAERAGPAGQAEKQVVVRQGGVWQRGRGLQGQPTNKQANK